MTGESDEELVAHLDVDRALVLQAADPLRLFHLAKNYAEFIFNHFEDVWHVGDHSEDDDPDEYVQWVCGLRNPRIVDTFEYAGEFLNAVHGTHSFESLLWSSLPAHERDGRWIDNFRMLEADFDELLQLCSPFMHEQKPIRGL
jgi:hypothetical protein